MLSIGPKFDPELKGPQLELELEFHGIHDSIKLSPPLLLLSHGIHGAALAILEINKIIVNKNFIIVVIFLHSPKTKNYTGEHYTLIIL
jgi:hypothetical protein